MSFKKLFALSLFILSLSLSACSGAETTQDDVPPDPPKQEEQEQPPVELTKIAHEYSLYVPEGFFKAGDSFLMEIESPSNRAVTAEWKSSDEAVLTVENGTVTAVAQGTATVTATVSSIGCESFELTATVEIKGADFELINLAEFLFITDYDARNEADFELASYILGDARLDYEKATNEMAKLRRRLSKTKENPYEILLGQSSREESIGVNDGLEPGEYRIKALKTEEGYKILIGASDNETMVQAIGRFIDEVITDENGAYIPSDINIQDSKQTRMSHTPDDYKNMIESSNIHVVRDPCTLYVDGKYYLYGTGLASGYGYGCVTSEDLITWSDPFNVYTFPEGECAGDCWAPEVHYYEGAYYLFATYRKASNDLRGCAIFKSESPAGPFEMITDGHLTSSEWHAIDATLYVDDKGDPWMVYVREWVSAPNNLGTFELVRLSDDLTKFVSEPVELFKADASFWSDSNVTDGCWLYEMESTGSLIMLWSTNDGSGYCIGQARSVSGSIEGPWEQVSTRLYSASYNNGYDGGHGSIFKDKNGQLMVSFHAPNKATDTVIEHAYFLPIEENAEFDMLVPKK